MIAAPVTDLLHGPSARQHRPGRVELIDQLAGPAGLLNSPSPVTNHGLLIGQPPRPDRQQFTGTSSGVLAPALPSAARSQATMPP
jgi:hypothetical protein